MNVDIAYGKGRLTVDVPDANLVTILRMNDQPLVNDPYGAVLEKLASPTGTLPLAEIAEGKHSACIVVSDITRPVPNAMILPPVLHTLEQAGIATENITILVATGLHRPNEGDELISLLGPEIPKKYRVINHRGRDRKTHEFLGETPIYKAPVYVDTRYLRADIRILTGLIEPHLMAGFSGGRKAVMPGICGAETVMALHGFEPMGHELAVEGSIEDNPVHREMLYVAKKAGVDFMLNVALNEERGITGVFAGELEAAHDEGVDFVRGQCLGTVDGEVDAVITTSAGYPLDLTFYQAVKGMTAAAPIVRDGGVIVIAAACDEGIGGEEFTRLMLETETVDDFLSGIRKPGHAVIDQWQLQKFTQVLERAEVWLYSGGIDKTTQRRLFVTPLDSMEEGVRKILERFGEHARIAVIPEGPYVLAETC